MNVKNVPVAPLSILYEDHRLLIADKNINTIVHGMPHQHTLLRQVQDYMDMTAGPGHRFLAPSNRLDRNTGGPVVFAKDRDTACFLRRLFARCEVRKTYSARLTGLLEMPVFVEADIFPGRHRRARVDNLKISPPPFPDKREWFSGGTDRSSTISATVITPLRPIRGTTLAEIQPWTGRFHQIRVVCQAIGHPVYGDKKYFRVPGLRRAKKRSAPWTIPALLCQKLEIESLGIAVETRLRLDDIASIYCDSLPDLNI